MNYTEKLENLICAIEESILEASDEEILEDYGPEDAALAMRKWKHMAEQCNLGAETS